MTDHQTCKDLINFAMSEFSQIDILFMAHGVGAHKFFEDMKTEDLKVYQ